MKLTMTRGDTQVYRFQRKKNGDVLLTPADEIYFTIKNTALPLKPLLMKTINDMDFNAENGTYRFVIHPEDTAVLPIGTYRYDIQVTDNGVVKTVAKGDFELTWEVTFYENTVGENNG